MIRYGCPQIRLPCPSKKLAPKFMGPFPVKRKINLASYELSLPNSLKIHPVFHVSLLKPAAPDPFPNRGSKPPEPVQIDGCEEYVVEIILDCRKRQGQNQFLVKWKGYGPEDNSWEPEGNLHAKKLLRAFFLAHPDKKARLGIRRLPLGGGQCQGLTSQPHPSSFLRKQQGSSMLTHRSTSRTPARAQRGRARAQRVRACTIAGACVCTFLAPKHTLKAIAGLKHIAA